MSRKEIFLRLKSDAFKSAFSRIMRENAPDKKRRAIIKNYVMDNTPRLI